MVKLTPEQRKLNKEATKLRDKAFKARRDAYREERDMRREAIDSGPLGQASKKATEEYNAVRARREIELQAIDAKIKELTLKRAKVEHSYKATLATLEDAKNIAVNARNQAQYSSEYSVKQKYADVADRIMASSWKHYEEFIPLVNLQDPSACLAEASTAASP